MVKTGIGQDSHKFEEKIGKPLIIGGILFEDMPGFFANSDGDVVLHAITNAISSITGVNILGKVADNMCKNERITDSTKYLQKAIEYLQGYKITCVSISIEGKRPKLEDKIEAMKQNIANIIKIKKEDVGITATTGEELTRIW
jgi:2-C-methyl-D-erythritol 2,4-cyclodiphosphate synthase